MSELLDVRPLGIDVLFRRGNTFTLTLNWLTGSLVGRTFTATLGAATLTVGVVGDVMTVGVTASQTTAAAESSVFRLIETTVGTQTIIIGTWGASDRPAASTTATVQVTQGAAQVDVTGVLGGSLDREFMEIPTGWGAPWRQALSEAGSRLVRVVWMGDSTSVGPFTGQGQKNYPAQLRNAFAAAGYPYGGSGYIDYNGSAVGGFGGPGGPNGPSTDAVQTGAWTLVTGALNNQAWQPTVAGNGATMTLFARGTTIDIISRTDPTFGRYDRQIDGGSVVQVPQNVAAAVQTTSIGGLTDVFHSVTTIAAAGQCRINGIRGRNATGVLVDNFSQGGRAINGNPQSFSTVAEGLGTKTSLEASFDAIPTCDLFVLVMGVNDGDGANTGTPQQMRETLASLHRKLRAVGGNNGQPDILVVIEHVSGFQDSAVPYRYSWIAETIRLWAKTHGAAVIDLWAFGRFSGEYGAAQGWFGFGATDVHPSDSGFVALSAPIVELIVQG